MEIKYALALSIKLQKFGILLLASSSQPIMGMKAKLLLYHLILTEFWWQQDQWIAQPNFGM
jgi:hypothetical protein